MDWDINICDNYGNTPLMITCQLTNNISILEKLIDNHANINTQRKKDGITCLMISALKFSRFYFYL